MLPMIIGGTVVTALAAAVGWRLLHPVKPENLPPAIVSQGVQDPTTGQTIVTMADEQKAFANVAKQVGIQDIASQLYTYIKAHGYDGTPEFHTLVENFQNAANKVVLGTAFRFGKLRTDGVFDVTTAYPLAHYTNDPLPPDPSVPRPPLVSFASISTNGIFDPQKFDINTASPTAAAGWLLKKWIQKNGDNPKNPSEMVLTKVFQVSVNTDPVYAGQGWAMSKVKPPNLAAKLGEDGVLGPASKAQLYKNESQSDFEAQNTGTYDW